MLLGNYLIAGWRNLVRHKLFSVINILGLAIGLAAVIMIMLFVRDELNYDQFWSNSDSIYRVHSVFSVPGRDLVKTVKTPGPLIHALKNQFPQINSIARVYMQRPTVQIGIDSYIDNIALVDPGFVDIFDLEVISGDLLSGKQDTSSLVLNQTMAKKYFGDSNPIGEVLTLAMYGVVRDYKVIAVIKDIPSNSQVNIEAFAYLDEADWSENSWLFTYWYQVFCQLYFTLNTASDIGSINEQMDDFVNAKLPPSPVEGMKMSEHMSLRAMPIKDLHLKAVGFGEMRERGSTAVVITFTIVAALILAIASINFMNLSTARSNQRAREISLRKVFGASRLQLILQFLGESILITIIAMVFSLLFVELALPTYNEVLNKHLMVNYLSGDFFTLLGFTLCIGILAGLYPALILSGFKPSRVLKANKSMETSASTKLRSVLVILQFSVSISLFITTGVIYSQMNYARNIDLGYTKENMLMIKNIGEEMAADQQVTFLEELRRHPQVADITRFYQPVDRRGGNNILVRIDSAEALDPVVISVQSVGYDFFKTYQIPVLHGRAYDEQRSDVSPTVAEVLKGSTAVGKIMINQAAVRRLGFTSEEDAIGNMIYHRVAPPDTTEAAMEIIGIVPDVLFESLRGGALPELYFLNTIPKGFNTLSLRFTGDPIIFLEDAENLWKSLIPGVPFSYQFVDEAVALQYEAESGQATIFAVFASLAIIVACLGLYGLAGFTAERRTKEVGIRKILGAKVSDIIWLMLWQFCILVIIANLIAWPISFYYASSWLEGFSERISTGEIFVLSIIAAIASLLIASLTVLTNTLKVARSNPANALRYE